MSTENSVIKNQDNVNVNLLDKESTNLTEKNESKIKKFLKHIRGSVFGLLFSFSMCMVHIFVKMAPSLNGSNHSTIRYIIQFLVMSIFIIKNRLEFLGPKPQRKLLFIRGLVGGSAVILSFFSIQYLDVSDVETLMNSSVIITAIFARLFLNEKLTVCHIISLIITISGVLFIIRPNFLFGIENDLEKMFNINLTNLNHTHIVSNVTIKDHANRSFIDSLIGVSLILTSAAFISIVQVTLRKLCLFKIHFSVTTFYPALVGIPTSLILSVILYKANPTKLNINFNDNNFLIQLVYSICGGICGTMGAIFLHTALKYEDATKIGIVKTFGVFFSFILQYILLDIEVDFLGILGAIFIVTATITAMTIKLFDERYSNSKSILIRFLFKKF